MSRLKGNLLAFFHAFISKNTIGNKKVANIFGSLQLICYLCNVRNDKEFFNTMKQSDLCKRLKEAGCFIYRHGARHDIWESPVTGLRCPIPRHGAKEIPTGTLKSIMEKLLGH